MPDSGLLFWMLLAFIIVFAVLAKYGFPVITKMVEERKQYIDKSLKAADEANSALAGIKATSEKILAEAHEQQIKILNEATQAGEKIISDAKREAQVQAHKQLEGVRAQIAAEREEAIRAVRREIAVLSVDIAEKVTRNSLSRDKSQMDLVNRLLDEVITTH